MKKTLLDDNIKCIGCIASIKDRLKKIDGITKIVVDKDQGSVSIDYSDESQIEQVTKLLSILGYPMRGTSTRIHKGVSYISCLIGNTKTAKVA